MTKLLLLLLMTQAAFADERLSWLHLSEPPLPKS